METKSLIVGVLIGVCICLGAVFVLGQGVETAQAGPVESPGRYQIAVGAEHWPHVIDRQTGTVYWIKTVRGKGTWRRLLDGPPRERPKPITP